MARGASGGLVAPSGGRQGGGWRCLLREAEEGQALFAHPLGVEEVAEAAVACMGGYVYGSVCGQGQDGGRGRGTKATVPGVDRVGPHASAVHDGPTVCAVLPTPVHGWCEEQGAIKIGVQVEYVSFV